MTHKICDACFKKLGPMEELTKAMLGDVTCAYCLRTVDGKAAHLLAGECPAPGSEHPLFDARCTCTEFKMVWNENGEPDLVGTRGVGCGAHWPASLADLPQGGPLPPLFPGVPAGLPPMAPEPAPALESEKKAKKTKKKDTA